MVSAEEACNKAGAYRIVPIAKLKVDENNWGSKYEIIGGAEGALEVFYPPAPHFTDVDYSSWYAPGVDFVAGRGLMRGYEGTTIFGVGSDLSAFVDGADASEWAAPYLKWAADKGLIEGYDEPAGKRLAPGENASCERAATVLMRAFYLGVLK